MDIKRSYYEDIELFKSNTILVWSILFLIFLGILPWLVKTYHLLGMSIYIVNLITINALVAIGLNILVGYTGQISMGHAGFFAVGAFTTVIFIVNWGFPLYIALPIAGFISSAFGFILGLPALRLKGPYLAIATLGFGMTITTIIKHMEFFGGRMGLQAPKLYLFGTQMKDIHYYYVIMIIAVVMVIGALKLIKTRVGRAFIAIRDSDIAAEAMGVNLTYYKTLSFAVSAFYTGIAGGLYALILGFINPEGFTMIMSIAFLAMVVVGGLGSIMGSIAGAALLTYLDIKLQVVQDIPAIGPALVAFSQKYMSMAGISNIAVIVYGLIMILIVLFEPLGIFGFWIRTKRYWKTWPF
ncbi:MAG TPA: branched-chain amino acid ABC transporter permease [Thermodesulfobacteriota bacterium]|nr:branched-chain amino acid ABC transporter permease [Thermodesulfobacteriota bacterium]